MKAYYRKFLRDLLLNTELDPETYKNLWDTHGPLRWRGFGKKRWVFCVIEGRKK